MPVTNWDDRDGNDEIKSTDIDGLQDAAGKMEDIVGIQTKAVTGGSLVEEFCDATDRYRLYASADKNWLASPAPVIYVNSSVVSSGFVINYGGGCVEFDPPLDADDVVTGDFTCTKAEAKSVIPYVVASGSANTYAVTLSPAPTAYYEGMAVALKINVDNTGASTINLNSLGAKTIKRPNGSDVTAASLKANSIYTVRYNGTNFILQGEGGGGGNAAVGDVVAGKTFTNDAGEQTGTMTDRGTVNITPSTSNQSIEAGKHSGSGVVYGDADLVAGNIKSGVNIFGVAGSFDGASKVLMFDNQRYVTFVAGYKTGGLVLKNLNSTHSKGAYPCTNAVTSQKSGSDPGEMSVVTDSAIDLTNYTYLSALVYTGPGASYAAELIASTNKTGDHDTYDARVEAAGSSTLDYKLLKVDVSALNGSYYLRMHYEDKRSGTTSSSILGTFFGMYLS